jgi:voltage-gated potassium channel Kch
MLTLVASPVLTELQVSDGPIELLLFLNLAAAAVGAGTKQERIRLLVFILITAGMRIVGRLLNNNSTETAAAVLWIALAVAAAVSALRYALGGRNVDGEHLSAALSAYLLAGHFFGIIYLQIARLRPESFAIGGAPAIAGQIDLQNGIYFSFVTLATLGYGDIVPLTPTARGFAITEAIMGQLYLAVLVARLIGAAGNRK